MPSLCRATRRRFKSSAKSATRRAWADAHQPRRLLLQSAGTTDDALQILKEALQIERDVGNEDRKALCLNNIGNVYLSRGNTTMRRPTSSGRSRSGRKPRTPAKSRTRCTTSRRPRRTGQYDQALTHYFSALDLRREAGTSVGRPSSRTAWGPSSTTRASTAAR